jgi:hypothetical protein
MQGVTSLAAEDERGTTLIAAACVRVMHAAI